MVDIDVKTILKGSVIKLLNLISIHLLLMVLSGCATTQAPSNRFLPFSPQAVDKESLTLSSIVISQNRVCLESEYLQFSRFGVSLGLLGVALDAGQGKIEHKVNSERIKAAQKQVRPLNDLELAIDFRQAAEKAINGAIQASPWLKTNQTEVVPYRKNHIVDDVKESSVLNIELSHKLSIDASMLVVEAKVLFCRRNQLPCVYRRDFTYFSDRIGSQRVEDAIAKWSENSGELYRAENRKALSILVQMLNMELLAPLYSTVENKEVTLSLFNPVENKNVTWTGNILQQTGSRVVFQERSQASIFSFVPTAK